MSENLCLEAKVVRTPWSIKGMIEKKKKKEKEKRLKVNIIDVPDPSYSLQVIPLKVLVEMASSILADTVITLIAWMFSQRMKCKITWAVQLS